MNVVTVVKRGLTPPEGFQQAEGAFSASPPRGARQTPRAARGKHRQKRRQEWLPRRQLFLKISWVH
jgi:hypothetical protein